MARTATLLFDGTCRFCIAGSARLRRVARGGSLECVSYHDPGVLERFPQVTREMCESAMRLVTPEGRVHAGVGALAEVLATRWWLVWVRWVYAVAPARWALDRAYRVIGRNRHRLMGRVGPEAAEGGGCEGGACGRRAE